MVISYTLRLLGDEGVGKTCLLSRYVNPETPQILKKQIIFNDCTKTVQIRGNLIVELVLSDTNWMLDALRTMSYAKADAFLICFSVNSLESLKNVEHVWHRECQKYKKDVPIILVGTKNDLREQISLSEMKQMANKINAYDILLCSAVNGNGVEEVFIRTVSILSSNNKIVERLSCEVQ